MIKATKPSSVEQALARISDHFKTGSEDLSHLSLDEQEELFIEFSMAVDFIARENFIHPQRDFCLWLADKLYSDFPALSNYDENGNWVGPIANENGWTP